MFPPYDPYVFGRNLRMFRRWTTSTSMTQPRSAPASASAVGTRGTAFQAVWCHERCHKHDAAMLRAQLQLIMRGSSEFWRPTVMKRVKRGKRWKESVHTHTACSPRVSRREQSLNLQVFRYFHFAESCFLFYIMCRTCSASVCVLPPFCDVRSRFEGELICSRPETCRHCAKSVRALCDV